MDEEHSEIFTELHEDIKSGKAQLVKTGEQIQVKYSHNENEKFDIGMCCQIQAPRADLKNRIESFLEVIDLIQEKRFPSGILLDKTKISLKSKKTYEEDKDYFKTGKILGKGTYGKIEVLSDEDKLKGEHALKTVRIAHFNSDEIRCWLALERYSNFPSLYMFKMAKDKIHFHYEIIDEAFPMSDVIDNCMKRIRKNSELLRYFSLYVLQGLLEASSIMHSENWVHTDLHENNVMLQAKGNAELKVCVLDFGRVKKLDESKIITQDIQQIICVFTSVYVTERFMHATDLKQNWKSNLSRQAEEHQLSEENKKELLDLVEFALEIQLPEQEQQLKEHVDEKLKEKENTPDIMREITMLIFPD